MATLAEVEVLIKANMNPLVRSSKEAEKRISALEGKLTRAGQKAAPQFRRATSEINKMSVALKATTALAGTLAGSLAAGLFKRAITEFATFEQGMKNVQSVSGATKKELVSLSEAALKAAATTRFNPKQTTEALYALASSGQAAQEQIASLPNVLNFAEAAQADLGLSTEIVTSTLNVFGLEAAQSARVADVFTASIGASALNAQRIAVAMRNAGPTAAALGQSFESTTASLAILTSAFGNGERAGSGLRGILVELGKKAKTLGINIKDSKGSFLPLVDIIEQLEKRGVTATQIIENFGAEAGPSLAALLTKGSKALREMEENIKSNGQAAKVAGEQLDTLSGDFAGLSSAISAALVGIGESQSGLVRDTTQTVTNLVRLWSGYAETLGDAEEQTRTLSNALSVIAGIVATRVAAGMLTAASATGVLSAATILLTRSLRLLGLTNPLGLLITAIGAAVFGFQEFRDTLHPIQGELATLGDYGAVAWQRISDGVEKASDMIAAASSAIATYISEALGGAEISFADLGDVVKTVANGMIGAFVLVSQTITSTFTKLPAAIAEAVIATMNAMIAQVESALNKVVAAVNNVLGSLNSVGGNIGLSLGTIKPVDLGRITNAYKGAGKAAGAAYQKGFKALTRDFVGDAFDGLREDANRRARRRADDALNGPETGGTVNFSRGTLSPIPNGGQTLTPNPPSIGGGSKGKKGGGGGAKTLNDYEREKKAIQERTAALQSEFEAQQQLNPLIDDYGFATEKARIQQELLTAAKNAGLKITPALRQEIEELAEVYARTGVEVERLAEKQDLIKENLEDFRNTGRDALKGFISDLREGKSGAEALSNAISKIADKLFDLALDNLFGGASTGKGGGLFGTLFNLGSSLLGFSSGTANTGGQRGEPRGIVHGQEAVIPLNSGGNVPVDISGVQIPQSMSNPKLGEVQKVDLSISLITDEGAIAGIADTQIENSAPQIIRVAVNESQKQTKNNMAGYMANAQGRRL